MRRFRLFLPLLAVLCASAPAFAQSDAFKQAWQQSNALIDAGKYAQAESWAKQAVNLAQTESGPDSGDYASTIYNLARIYRYEGRYAEALPLYQRALAIFEKGFGPDNPYVATCLDNIAELYRAQGRYAEAEPLYQRSLAIREKTPGPNSIEAALSLHDLAALYHDEGRYAEAIPLYQRSLAIYEQTRGPDNPDVAVSLTNLALIYATLGRYADAEPLYQRALAIYQKTLNPDHPLIAVSLNNLAGLYDDQGRYAEAEPLQKRALAIDQKTLGPEHPAVAHDSDNLAGIYRVEGRYAEALPLYQQALAIRVKTLGPYHPDVAQSLAGLGVLYGAQGRYVEAYPFIHRAAAITALRAAGTKDDDKSGQAQLRSRRDIFLDDVAAAVSHMAARFAAGSDTLANLVRQRQDTQDRLDNDEAQILNAVSQPPDKRDGNAEAAVRAAAAALRQRLQQLDSNLMAQFPAYAELANPKPITIAAAQQLLAPDQALIVYAVGENESYIAVITRANAGIFGTPIGAKDLTAAVKALRRTLNPEGKTSVPSFDASDAYKLYQKIFAPAEPALKGVTQLYVVTDGALESLPLGVLLTAQPSADPLSATAPDQLRAAPWLARRYAVSVLPSVSSLKSLRQFTGAAHAPQPFMGFGDPTLTPQPGDNRGAPDTARGGTVKSIFRGDAVDQAELRDLPSLPETAGELQAEAKLFNEGQGSVLLADAATVTAVKRADLASRRVIAFATHGLLAGDVGVAEPGLVLTPPANPTPADDGLLKASEIAQLKLNADLVILSACNTAASDGTPGAEGFSGLSKAFLYAGTRSLMVSHWSVVSDSTVALMTRMAAQLEQKGIGRAEALRRAELALMDDKDHPEFAHPLFWAPFVVVGEGGVSQQ